MKKLLALCLVLLASLPARAAIDGVNIQEDFCPSGLNGCASLLQVQNNHTGFGDTYPPSGGNAAGSEMDQLFVYKTADSLAINITGNLEGNGNFWIIFLQVKPGGVNVVPALTQGPPGVTGQSGDQFDAGFAPNYALAMNVYSGTLYVDLVDLAAGTNTYLGSIAYGTSGTLTGGGSAGTAIAFDNTNSSGVTGDKTRTTAQTGLDAATATKGMEMLLKFADLGNLDPSVSQIGIMTMVTSHGGYVSNQILPGVGSAGQKDNLGNGPINFADESAAPGQQFATVNLTTNLSPPALEGTNIPQDSGSATLVATQNNYTQFGDNNSSGTSGSQGSELDALFMNNTSSALQIGIPGNLEPNGNYVLLFLQTGFGGIPNGMGMNVPAGVGPPSGILQGLNGTVFDSGFNPTHVLMISSGTEGAQAVAYVDLFDFRTNTGRYLGKCIVGSGSGSLTDGDNPHGAQVALDDSNALGVTADASKTATANQTDAQTADKGFELVLPFTDIGLGQTQIEYMAVLTGSSGYFSNQFLPGLGGGYGNLGSPPQILTNVAGLQYGSYTVTGLTFTSYPDLSSLKAQPDGATAQVTSTVSAVFSDQDQFYLEDSWPGNLSGILVQGMSSGLNVGDNVTVKGFLTLVGGERAINAQSVVKNAGIVSVAPPGPKPISTGNKSIGGASIGANPGPAGGIGANNVGLLMRSWGTVTGALYGDDGYPYFYIDDGSGLYDGNIPFMWKGLLVNMPFAGALPNVGDYVAVTGVSSIVQTNGVSQPRLRNRTDGDVVTLSP